MLDVEQFVDDEIQKPYMQTLIQTVSQERKKHIIYPDATHTMAWMNTNFEELKVVIIGQDPYINEGEANGYAFAVNGSKIPPSLKNIFLVLQKTIEGFTIPKIGNLEKWSDQGVLLLNSVLTTRAKSSGSHTGIGWEHFTSNLLDAIASKYDHIVFICWGNYAIDRMNTISNINRHYVLKATHPSPYSANTPSRKAPIAFMECNHFNECNAKLVAWNKAPIDWTL